MLLDFFLRNKVKIIILAVLFSIISVVLTGAIIMLNQDTFYNGIRVEGVDLSGLYRRGSLHRVP